MGFQTSSLWTRRGNPLPTPTPRTLGVGRKPTAQSCPAQGAEGRCSYPAAPGMLPGMLTPQYFGLAGGGARAEQTFAASEKALRWRRGRWQLDGFLARSEMLAPRRCDSAGPVRLLSHISIFHRPGPSPLSRAMRSSKAPAGQTAPCLMDGEGPRVLGRHGQGCHVVTGTCVDTGSELRGFPPRLTFQGSACHHTTSTVSLVRSIRGSHAGALMGKNSSGV